MLRKMIENEAVLNDWSISYARDILQKAKLIFKWAYGEGLVEPVVYERLNTADRGVRRTPEDRKGRRDSTDSRCRAGPGCRDPANTAVD